MKRLLIFGDWFSAGVLILFGLFHFTMSLIYMDEFSVSEIMYSTAGLAFVFSGFLHIIRIRNASKPVQFLSIISTLLLIGVLILVALAFTDARVFIVIAALVYLAISQLVAFSQKAEK